MNKEELIYELPKGIIKWYDFCAGSKAIYVMTSEKYDEALAQSLKESGLLTDSVSIDEFCRLEEEEYFYIIIGPDIEKRKNSSDIIEILKKARALLNKKGKLFLLADNRLAIRYFCGDRDPFTNRNFDGIENYKRIGLADQSDITGRLYAKAELEEMLERAGFMNHKFYSVFPKITCPQVLFAEDYIPEEELCIRIFPEYDNPDTVFLEEENLYTSLVENKLFHAMANGFLIECCLDQGFSHVQQVTVSVNRGKENGMCTVIRRDGKVVKKPLYVEGREKVKKLNENNIYLQKHGVKMIDARIEGNSFVMPYVKGVPLVRYFRRLARESRQEFYKQFDRLWGMILFSSEHVSYKEVDWEHFDPWWDEEKDEKRKAGIDREKWRKIAFGTKEEKDSLGAILERGYIDLVLLNGFMADGEFVFYDQELYMENMPAKAIMFRNINFLYHGDTEMEKILPRQELMEHYKVNAYKDIFFAYERYFLDKLRNDKLLEDFYRSRRRNYEVVHSNRQRINYSTQEYLQLFVNIFRGLDKKKLYLFGSGDFTKKFLALYKEEYEIAGILDNDKTKWGRKMEGIEIFPPAIIKNLDVSAIKVIICIKNYTGVLKQLRNSGIIHVGIYDTNMEYPRKKKVLSEYVQKTETAKKKYQVGYIAGVFDLFHIGHLNLLRRAKEQCDYLIVGVVTDEGVCKNKKTESFIPFEERIEIVKACRYVDEAVGIPLEFSDTKDAYLKFQFDVQFSGSDYSEDALWMKKRDYLRKQGAELIFFPYTESTSSTKIKEMIDRRLM